MWHSTLTEDLLNIKNEVRKELKCSILENGKYTMIKSILRQILCDAIKCGGIPMAGKGNGNPLQYSYLENPMDRGAWWATVHRITKSWTWLSD